MLDQTKKNVLTEKKRPLTSRHKTFNSARPTKIFLHQLDSMIKN